MLGAEIVGPMSTPKSAWTREAVHLALRTARKRDYANGLEGKWDDYPDYGNESDVCLVVTSPDLLEWMVSNPVEGYGDMPDDKVAAIADGSAGKAWNEPSARAEVRRRELIAQARGEGPA